ncbi:MAG: hypothetical protein IKI06_05990 [Prevotella sp.]|nr:hypothetical protein [Prevotella sp.]
MARRFRAILHVFNPEHDIALAANLGNFTAPHAGRQLRHDLGYLPAIWAAPGDYVLVDDVAWAQTAYTRLMHRPFEWFVDKHAIAKLDIDHVEPWGWDLALREFLLRYGVKAVPSEETIAVIRDLSHRKTAVWLLENLKGDGLIGASWQTDSQERVGDLLRRHQHLVVKAPWSSSGRGIRFIDGMMDNYQVRWLQNVITRQGSVVVEPHYQKVKDFGMEFESDGEGRVRYLGLSLFYTQNGTYTGNILATEEAKREMIGHYLPTDLLDTVQQRICECLGERFQGKYRGPFGIDMMIVDSETDGFLLHPCVEINLRRTMGHVALELSP